MKKTLLFTFLIVFYTAPAQNKTVEWLNQNAIPIEEGLTSFSSQVSDRFRNARVFGFGEASHHGKEFFELKAEFFKYLVQNQGVRVFIMEESYQAERPINQWISGGEGSPEQLRSSFGQWIWRKREVMNLLQWMRDYNTGKPRSEQVRFYGMDNQFGREINLRLRDYIKKQRLAVDESLLVSSDSCANGLIKAGGVKKWADRYLPDLLKIEQLLINNHPKVLPEEEAEYQDLLRGLHYLKQFTAFVQSPYSATRDRDMFDNVCKILQMEGPQAKAFIWAHNEHINKNSYGTYSIKSVGRWLKEEFKEGYYAVGFDFGNGLLPGYTIEKRKVTGGIENRKLDQPYPKTYAETLVKCKNDVYFVDMLEAIDKEPTHFFETKNRQLFLGGPGFDAKRPFFFKRKYSQCYDGLIFVKTISPATY